MPNIVQESQQIKMLSDQQLTQEMQSPSGIVPQYLILGELMRRQKLRQASPQPQPPSSTIAQEVVSRVPQQQQQMPVRGYQAGGLVDLSEEEQGGLMELLQSLDPRFKAYDVTSLQAAIPDIPAARTLEEVAEEYRKLSPETTYYDTVGKAIQELQGEIGQRRKRAGKEGLLQAGLAMMAGGSPFAMQNIGAGGLAGLQGYQRSRDLADQMQQNLLWNQGQLATLQHGQKTGDARNIAQLFGDYEQSRTRTIQEAEQNKRANLQALVRAQLAEAEARNPGMMSSPAGVYDPITRKIIPGTEPKSRQTEEFKPGYGYRNEKGEIVVPVPSKENGKGPKERPLVNAITERRDRVRRIANRVIAESRAGGGTTLDDAIRNLVKFSDAVPDLKDDQIKADVIAEIESRKPRVTQPSGSKMLDRHLGGAVPAVPGGGTTTGGVVTHRYNPLTGNIEPVR